MPRRYPLLGMVGVALLSIVCVPAAAQTTLAEAAAAAAKIKHDGPLASYTFTNKDLKDAPPPAAIPAVSPPTVSTALAGDLSEKSESTRAAEYRVVARKDEAYWKSRLQDLQRALDTDLIHLVAMQDRVASLAADFDTSQSVSERIVLRRAREDAATEALRLRAAVIADRRAIGTAEEEARRAHVPPGWLRP